MLGIVDGRILKCLMRVNGPSGLPQTVFIRRVSVLAIKTCTSQSGAVVCNQPVQICAGENGEKHRSPLQDGQNGRMAWETSQAEVFIFLKAVSKKIKHELLILSSEAAVTVLHDIMIVKPIQTCGVKSSTSAASFMFLHADDVRPSRADFRSIHTAHTRNHITRLVLNLDLHNLIHGVAFMRRASCGSLPPDQSSALHSAQAR